MSSTPAPFAAWVGRQHTVHDCVTQAPVNGLSAALDYPRALATVGSALPACWHWLYFLEPARASSIAVDGHPQRGDFLPPIELPRRMWAGSRLHFHAPVYVGDILRRVSTIVSIEHKVGRSGELVFVTLHHAVMRDHDCLLEEEQDLVFRAAPVKQAAASHATGHTESGPATLSRLVYPDPVLLFRYSALTLNSHRIHYDRSYAVEQEGYAGLVVQGPLTATLLLDLLRREGVEAPLKSFEFRAVQPLTDGAPVRLCANKGPEQIMQLWAEDARGDLSMSATAEFSVL